MKRYARHRQWVSKQQLLGEEVGLLAAYANHELLVMYVKLMRRVNLPYVDYSVPIGVQRLKFGVLAEELGMGDFSI